jgi:segregation and condensation protein A
MDIFDLDIARITEDYLAIIEREGVRDLAGAYHFLAMAATLVELKSRQLLPRREGEDGEGGEDSGFEEDPRTMLARQLSAYQSIQELTGDLARRFEETGRHWPRQVVEQFEAEVVYSLDSLNVLDLMNAFAEVLSKPRFSQAVIFTEDYSIDEARDWLHERLAAGAAPLIDLLASQRDVFALLVTFIALLEMIKQEEASFEQRDEVMLIALSQGEIKF